MIKKSILSVAVMAVAVMNAGAENYNSVLAKIVAGSRQLKVAAGNYEAEKSENNTGLTLENPEAEVSVEGSPDGIPVRTIVNLQQGFDFATLSGAKRNLARQKDMVSQRTLQLARRDVEEEADALMTEIVYRNKLKAYYITGLTLCNGILKAAEKSFNNGDISIVDLNLIRMEVSTLSTEKRLNDLETANATSSLLRLAGGAISEWSADQYCAFTLPLNINTALDEAEGSNAEIRLARANVDLAESEVSLRKREGLPSFSVGYTNELVAGANYFGGKVGFELPLWANRGRVKAAKVAKAAAELAEENARYEFQARQKMLYHKAIALQNLEKESRRLRDECDIREGLKKMYDVGELSVHDYLSQLQPLMELDKRVLEAEHDYQVALVEYRAALK